MSDVKYEIFNLITGKFETLDVSPEEHIDMIAKQLSEQSQELYQMYKAERDIVRSILKKATESDGSTD
jgi:hypothetical protein